MGNMLINKLDGFSTHFTLGKGNFWAAKCHPRYRTDPLGPLEIFGRPYAVQKIAWGGLMYECIYVCMNVSMYVWMYLCMYEYIYVWMYLCIYECIYVCMNIFMYVWM